MHKYSKHGFRNFIVCAGYKQEVIKDYFLKYRELNSEFTVDFEDDTISFHSKVVENWTVTVVNTGLTSMTGYRVFDAASRYLPESCTTFALTYGDGLTNADLGKELEFHREHGKVGTVLGIHPPARFGEMVIKNSEVVKFSEKKPLEASWISGGFFFFEKEFVSYLEANLELVLEEEPMKKLVEDKQLRVYQHEGFWACMDTQRDHDLLENLLMANQAPWI
jgi:glucose-1-phosphate cytidylyltransferase